MLTIEYWLLYKAWIQILFKVLWISFKWMEFGFDLLISQETRADQADLKDKNIKGMSLLKSEIG